MDRAVEESLIEVINERTSGNWHETVELLNALRHEDVLTTTTGRRWDDTATRARLGQSEAARLRAAQLKAMPPPFPRTGRGDGLCGWASRDQPPAHRDRRSADCGGLVPRQATLGG